MSRVKHITMLIFKLSFIVLCFAIASVFTVLQSAVGKFDNLKNQIPLDQCEVLVLDSSFDENGASLSYEIKDGKIVFDIVQSGKNYDDISVLITYPAYSYDCTNMRNYLYETIGNRAEKEEDYLKAMEEGPWKTTFSYMLEGNTEGANSKNVIYTVADPDYNEFTDSVQYEDGEKTTIREIYVEKNEKLSFMLTFGAEGIGALKSGQYTFSADLSVSGLWENSTQLSFLTMLDVIGTTCKEAIFEKGVSIFQVENWLTFYGIMVVTGMFIYLWRDLRMMVKIFSAIMDSMSTGVRVIIHTYINGAYAGSRETYEGSSGILLASIITILCFMVFTITIPIRILIYVIRDIVYLFKEDYDLDEFSFIGNIMGSVGIYVLVFGFVGLLSANLLLGGISTVVGVIMCIVASKLCKRKEE
ncbi:MAG: hypothetical protein IKA02_02090 [Clostridia bacterium]|nr:hypothetical protein [Clostridia bacterium]